MLKIVVMVSGGGTNLQALIGAQRKNLLSSGRIELVISSNPGAYALERAKKAGIPGYAVSKKELGSQEAFEAEIMRLLKEYDIELIVLAGFMSILSKSFTASFPRRIINVHPSLIPSFCGQGFYGLRVHEAALAKGVKVTGATVHFVNEIPDGGEIIMQKAVSVREDDTPATLQKRVMRLAEWRILPAAVEKVADTFKMVYTPFHGTGYKLIPEALRRLGMQHVICVPQQMIIDGDFPTVASPNPENPEGFSLAVDIAKREGADFILGSDPDADRVGIMVRTKDDDFVVISGNQTGVLLLDYLIGAKTRTGKMPANPVALKSLVTTEMARKVAEDNGLKCFDTFTGFKFLAEKKDQLESSGEGNVIMSYEESFGYMLGSFVRDKDAVTASVALTEMAAWYAGQGMTLYDALLACYEKYGYYGEKTLNLVMPGLDGLKKMAQLMADLREKPPVEIAGVGVLQQKDYQDGSVVNVGDGAKSTMELSGSNVLRYELVDGTSVIVRPSGTEPKVKVYILARGESQADCAAKVERYAAWAEGLKG